MVTKQSLLRPRPRQTWPKKASLGRTMLRLLVKFLDINFDTVELKTFERDFLLREIVRCARYGLAKTGGAGLMIFERPNWRRKAKAVQRELKRDLLNILKTAPTDQARAVTRFVTKLEKVDSGCKYLTSHTSSVGGKPPQPVFSLRDYPRPPSSELYFKDRGAFICGGTVYSLALAPGESLWDHVYWMLGRVIEQRFLEDLRTCSQCGSLYVTKNFRQRYCGIRCKDEFHNHRRLRDGYFPNYRRKVRAVLFKKARRLLQEGYSILAIEEETKLSRRILERAGLIPHH